MRPTQLKKELVLNKETIVNLNDDELNQIKGGLPWTDARICLTRNPDLCPGPTDGCSTAYC